MSEQGSLLGFLSDPRLAPYATGDIPAWLWSADATRILWGNPAAAAIFNAASSAALTGHTIDPKGSAALQIARLAGTLPHGAAPRLERLRGFGGRMGGALMCACSRISLADRTPAILVVATEAPARGCRSQEQAQRLLAGCDEPLRCLPPTARCCTQRRPRRPGSAAPPRSPRSARTALGATALAAGRAEGDHAGGRISIERLGAGRIDRSAGDLCCRRLQPSPPPSRRPSKPTPPPRAAEPPAPAAAPLTATRSEPPRHRQATRSRRRAAERRQPLRFVWQMDDDSRFTLGSDEFKALIGPQTAAALGQPWNDLAAALGLDPEGQVARAFASRDTWSGINVAFPVDGSDARLPSKCPDCRCSTATATSAAIAASAFAATSRASAN